MSASGCEVDRGEARLTRFWRKVREAMFPWACPLLKQADSEGSSSTSLSRKQLGSYMLDSMPITPMKSNQDPSDRFSKPCSSPENQHQKNGQNRATATQTSHKMSTEQEQPILEGIISTGQDLNLNGRTIDVPTSSQEHACTEWLRVPIWPQQEDVTEAWIASNSGLHSLLHWGSPLRQSIILKVFAWCPFIMQGAQRNATRNYGAVMRDGTLQLKPNTVLVLDGSCHGVHFENLTISGGVLVCQNQHCNVTFNNVNFTECTLMALEGANVTLESSHFTLEPESHASLSIFIHGSTTVAYMHGSISGGTKGVLIQAGGTFLTSDVAITNVSVCCIDVKDEYSSASLHRCKLENSAPDVPASFMPADEEVMDCTGLHVHVGGDAELRNCVIVSMNLGVDVCGDRSEVILQDCTVFEAVQQCVICREGALATMSGCSVYSSRQREGVLVIGTGSKVRIHMCEIHRNAWAGVAVREGGSLTAEACKAWNNGCDGFGVHDVGSEMQLNDCKSLGNENGCHVWVTGGQLTACNVTVEECISNGFLVEGSGSMVLSECSAAQCLQAGICAQGFNSRVHVSGSQFIQNSTYGIVAEVGATVFADTCMSTLNVHAGYHAHGVSSTLELSRCTSTEDVDGCSACDKGRVLAQHVEVTESTKGGFRVFREGVIELKDCMAVQAASRARFYVDVDPQWLVLPETEAFVVPVGLAVVSKHMGNELHLKRQKPRGWQMGCPRYQDRPDAEATTVVRYSQFLADCSCLGESVSKVIVRSSDPTRMDYEYIFKRGSSLCNLNSSGHGMEDRWGVDECD